MILRRVAPLLLLACLLLPAASANGEDDLVSRRRHRYVSLIDELDPVRLAARLSRASPEQLEDAFASLFADADWVWTVMSWPRAVTRLWVSQLSSYADRRSGEARLDRGGGDGWRMHCEDAWTMCNVSPRCLDIRQEVIDSCGLNPARIFGDASLDEALRFAREERKRKIRLRMRRRQREGKCRAYVRLRRVALMKRRKHDHVTLIGRSTASVRRHRHQLQLQRVVMMQQRRRKTSSARMSWEEVLERMRWWGGKRHVTPPRARVCEDLEEGCPWRCYDALRKLNATRYGPMMFGCECSASLRPRNETDKVIPWDERVCHHQQRLVDACRPKVYSPLPPVRGLTSISASPSMRRYSRPGCTAVMSQCRHDRACLRSYRRVLLNCAPVIEHADDDTTQRCPLNCVASLAQLYAAAPRFHRCRPDGVRRPHWHRWHRNLSRSCDLECALRSDGADHALTIC